MQRALLHLASGLLAAICGSTAALAEGNVLLVIVDDLGVDKMPAYGEHPNPGKTPTIDRLAEQGVLFRNAWSHPVCSPTRAAIFTGRAAFRTGIGRIVALLGEDYGLPYSELTLPELLSGSMHSSMIGKWHLGAELHGPVHPNRQGFPKYSGSLGNPWSPFNNYNSWTKTTNGHTHVEPRYATTDTVDEALRAMVGLPEPWLLVVSFNAAHRPLHVPPDHLFTQEVMLPDADDSNLVRVMCEAMDTELARLLAAVPDNTTGFLCSDNGTISSAITPPWDPTHSKGTLYEGGIRVPLIAWGAAVEQQGSECHALVQLSDLFATIAQLAGLTSSAEDSVSLLPYLSDPAQPSIREFTFSEHFFPNGFGPYSWQRWAVRNERYKLIRLEDHDELYDLVLDPHEQRDLLLGEMTQDLRVQYLELAAVIGTG